VGHDGCEGGHDGCEGGPDPCVCVCKNGPGPLNNIHAEFVGYMYTVTVALLVVSRRRDINSSGSTLRAVAG
jgi:hypothetical protein